MSIGGDDWWDLPRPAPGIKLVSFATAARDNLHDTEEPALETATTPPAPDGAPERTDERRHLQRHLLPAHGQRRDALRPQRAVEGGLPRHRQPDEPEPAPRQRRAADAHDLPAGHHPQRDRRGVDSVHGPRLVRAQEGRVDAYPRRPGGERRRLARTADAGADDARRIRPKVADSTRPPTYINENTHWWDGSHVYGSSPAAQASLRAGRDGKVHREPERTARRQSGPGREITGFTENGWVGLSLLHALFALEHNAICDTLKKHNPLWDDERLFQQARLVNAALLAKIHTVEWSVAILPADITATGLRANWYGRFSRLQNAFPKLADNDIFSGIPGSPTEHHDVPFSLTEEFVSVYRMHPLMPDHFTAIKSAKTGEGLANAELPELSGHSGVDFLTRFDVADLFYSFGIHHPGAVRLHNYPKTLQNLVQDNGDRFDLGAVDILRDRERSIRYNRFRPAAAQARDPQLRRADRRPAVGRGDEAGLRQRPERVKRSSA